MGTRSYKLHSIYTQLSFLSSDSLNSLNKIQAFDVILDATTESIPVNGENVQLTQTFTFLGSVIHSSTSCEPEVYRQLGVERDEFAGRSCVALPIFVQKDEGPSLSLAVPSGLAIFL